MQKTATQHDQQGPVPGVSRILQEMSLPQRRSRYLECLLLVREGPVVLLPQHEPVTPLQSQEVSSRRAASSVFSLHP